MTPLDTAWVPAAEAHRARGPLGLSGSKAPRPQVPLPSHCPIAPLPSSRLLSRCPSALRSEPMTSGGSVIAEELEAFTPGEQAVIRRWQQQMWSAADLAVIRRWQAWEAADAGHPTAVPDGASAVQPTMMAEGISAHVHTEWASPVFSAAGPAVPDVRPPRASRSRFFSEGCVCDEPGGGCCRDGCSVCAVKPSLRECGCAPDVGTPHSVTACSAATPVAKPHGRGDASFAAC